MLNETIECVKGAAQSFTYRGKILSFSNPDFPLAVFTDGFNTINQSESSKISEQSVTSVEEHFENTNQETIEPIKDEREAIIANTHAGVAQLQYNAHHIMIPAIKAMCKSFAENFNTRIQPDVSVDVYEFPKLLDDADLVNHLSENYSGIQINSEYRTFLLESRSAEEIIDFIANNNNHFERETLTEWMLALGADVINDVFNAMFLDKRAISLASLSFLQLGKAPFNTSSILVAYFLLAALRDNPSDRIVGESVSLEEWTQTMSTLHAAMGRVLLNACSQRMQMREDGLLVLKYEADKFIQTRKVRVILNGDICQEWLNDNTVEVVLGAAVSNKSLTTTQALAQVKDDLINVWNTTYPILKQSALDQANIDRRKIIVKAFLDNAEAIENLVELDNIHLKVDAVLNECSLNELENHFLLFTKLVCKVSGSDDIYLKYLEAIDEYSRVFPEASSRELETQALISVIALYLSRQITMVNYTPEIDNTPEVPTEPSDEVEEEPAIEPSEDDESGSEEPTETPEGESEDEPEADDAETEEPNETKDLMSELDDMDSEDE